MHEPDRQPLIIIGMHRSGTSMLARLLKAAGVFMGQKVDENMESVFFQKLNEWLLRQCGASWHNPEPVKLLLSRENARALAVDYIACVMSSRWAISYLGLLDFIRHRDIRNLSIPFGWKDPRNTYTLPIWLDIFPRAKVIYVYRHGIDVANSLLGREDEVFAMKRARHARKKKYLRYWLRPFPPYEGFLSAPGIESLEDGVSIWENYNRHALALLGTLGNRAFSARYEDFLENPEESIGSLMDFCNLDADGATIDKLAASVRPGRAFAYKNNTALRKIAESVTIQLGILGYEA